MQERRADGGHVPWRDILTREHAGALSLACFAVWLHAADGLLVATMLPAIVADIGRVELMAWVVMLYELGSIVAGAASGLLANRLGVARPMVIAAGVFALGCAVSALAPAMAPFLAGRALQGLGGGGLMALSFVSVGVLFPPRLQARALGAVSTVWAASAFLGPLVGGLFVAHGSWRAAFWFFAAQAVLLGAWAGRRSMARFNRSGAAAPAPFPALRLGWLIAGVLIVAYAGEDISAVQTPAALVAGFACLAVFLRLDRAAAGSRLMPRTVIGLADPVAAGLTMIVCLSAATIVIGAYVPFFLTTLHGLSALHAGYLIALEAIAWGIVATLVSGRSERSDPMMIAGGIVTVFISILIFAAAIGGGPVQLVALAAFAQGAGFGAAWTFLPRRLTGICRAEEEKALVAAAIPTLQRIGYALGAALLGIVANIAGIAGGTREDVARAATVLFLATLPVAAIGLLAMARFIRAPVRAGG